MIPPQFEEAKDFDGELAKVLFRNNRRNEYGYVNRQGKMVWQTAGFKRSGPGGGSLAGTLESAIKDPSVAGGYDGYLGVNLRIRIPVKGDFEGYHEIDVSEDLGYHFVRIGRDMIRFKSDLELGPVMDSTYTIPEKYSGLKCWIDSSAIRRQSTLPVSSRYYSSFDEKDNTHWIHFDRMTGKAKE